MASEFSSGDIIVQICGTAKYWVHGFMDATNDSYYVLREPYNEWDSTISGDKDVVEYGFVKVGEFRNGVEVPEDEVD